VTLDLEIQCLKFNHSDSFTHGHLPQPSGWGLMYPLEIKNPGLKAGAIDSECEINYSYQESFVINEEI
jgi:hypothetical protein